MEADQRLIENVFMVFDTEVEDVECSGPFYTQTLGFELEHQQLPDFAAVWLERSRSFSAVAARRGRAQCQTEYDKNLGVESRGSAR